MPGRADQARGEAGPGDGRGGAVTKPVTGGARSRRCGRQDPAVAGGPAPGPAPQAVVQSRAAGSRRWRAAGCGQVGCCEVRWLLAGAAGPAVMGPGRLRRVARPGRAWLGDVASPRAFARRRLWSEKPSGSAPGDRVDNARPWRLGGVGLGCPEGAPAVGGGPEEGESQAGSCSRRWRPGPRTESSGLPEKVLFPI